MKQVIIIILFLVCALQTIAQKGSITGCIYDPQKKGIALATVTVFSAADTAIITYRLSNEKGVFKIAGLPQGQQLRFLVTYSGYEAYRQEFKLTDSLPGVQYDSILMVPSQKQLDEVVLMSERPPVTIKNDTIEFNANSFKTLPNAIVEDLLKKLPGVQVDKDGNITVNGKPVNRMLVDGKNFFGSDPKMASRNLPANIIDKIQVTDDKEELARSSDNNVNNVGKVVNITLKKGVKKGVFGKLYAGLGTDDRFEGGGIANLFRDTLQVSLLGYANNLNKPGFGFSELMESGGLERSNSNLNSRNTSVSNNSSGGSSISVNGINFGGMQRGGGIAESKGVGININHAPNLKQSIFGQYFYGNVQVDKLVSTNVKQYNGDTVITNNTGLGGKVLTNAHNFGLGIKLKPDSVTTFQASANYTIGLQDEHTLSLVDSYNNLSGKLSDGRIVQSNEAYNHYYRHAISYTRLSKQKKGRRISAYQNLDVNKGTNAFNTDSRTTYINPNPYDTVLAQLREERIPRTDASAGFTARNPLNDRFTLTLTSRYEYSKLNNRVNTFGQDSAGDKANIIAALSSNFSRLSQRFQNTAGLEFRYRKLTATAYVRGLWQKIDNDLATLPAPIKQNRFDVLPSLSLVYGKLNVYYDKSITLPSYSYLIPVLNNSNPYYIVKGNPNLVPAERNSFSTYFYFNDPKKKLNINFNGNIAFIKNDVVQRITLDDNGIQTTLPVNANGSRTGYLNYNINKEYKSNKNVVLRWSTGAYYGYNRNRLLYNGNDGIQTTWSISQWAGLHLIFNDKVEWNNDYDFTHTFTGYSNKAFNSLHTFQQTLSTEFIVRVPKHITWEATGNYDYNGNVPAGLPKDALRVNLAVNLMMLKGDKGVLRFMVWDLLDRNNNINLAASRNMITAIQSNALGRYFMTTFTYNIRSVNGNKKKSGNGIFGY